MFKTLLSFFCSFLLVFQVASQGVFQKKLDVFLESPMLRVTSDGNAFYIADAYVQNNINRLYLYKLDANGNVLWRREQFNTTSGLTLTDMETAPDGSALLLCSVTDNSRSNAWLIQVKADGALDWVRRAGRANHTQLFDIQCDDSGDWWYSALHLSTGASDSSYHYLAKTDPNGAPIAGKQAYFRYFSNTGYEACRFTDLMWNGPNNRLVFVEDFENIYNQSAISSPNRGRSCLGYCSGNFVFDEKFTQFKISRLENADTVLIFSGQRTHGDFVGYEPAIGILDSSGKNSRILKRTPSLYQPLRSRSGSIVYYIPGEKMLVQFDAALEPVWSVKLDNCSETEALQGEVAPDGSIYTVRNIDQKTIVAKIAPNGSSSACATYQRTAPVMTNEAQQEWVTYNPKGYFDVPAIDSISEFVLTEATGNSTDFCIRLDATFEVPDTICLGTEIIPDHVDTTEGLRHTWILDDFLSEDSIPILAPSETGRFSILHRLENNICHDTASQYIQVLQSPVVPEGDTLVCGPAALDLSIGNGPAERVFVNGQPVMSDIHIDQSGVYTIRIENPGCFAEKSLYVRIVPFDPPLLPLDHAFCLGDTVQVALRPDFENVIWDGQPWGPDSFSISDGAPHFYLARYAPDTTCKVSGMVIIARKKCSSDSQAIFVPNVFRPNGPEPGNILRAFPTAIAHIQGMRIFNRWGALVFSQEGAFPEWNGENNPPGVYTYWIEYIDKSDGSNQVQAGDILLLK